jgi:hypothetical protein
MSSDSAVTKTLVLGVGTALAAGLAWLKAPALKKARAPSKQRFLIFGAYCAAMM